MAFAACVTTVELTLVMRGVRLEWAAWRVSVWLESETHLAGHPGSILAGVLGAHLRAASCTQRDRCDALARATKSGDCAANIPCDYGELVRTRRPRGAAKTLCEVPRPLIVSPLCPERERYGAGQIFAFDITLIGAAIERRDAVFRAIETAGKIGVGRDYKTGGGRFGIESVRALCDVDVVALDSENPLWRHNAQNLFVPSEDASSENGAAAANGERLKIEFESPVRLLRRGFSGKNAPLVGAREWTFLDFWLALRSRLINLSQDFGEGYTNDFPREAERVRVVRNELQLDARQRYSGRQNCENEASGLLGKVEFAGNIAPFLPYLKLGEWLHIGKNADLGQGRYRIR